LKKTKSLLGKTLLATLAILVISSPFMASSHALFSANTSGTNDPTVFFSPYRVLGTTVGQTVTVSLMISNVQDLWAFQAGLLFNPKVVKCTNVVEGGFLSNNGANHLLAYPGSIDNTNGIVYFYGWSLESPSSPMSGSGPLMNVTFQVLAVGYSDIHVADWIPLQATTLNDIPTTTIDYFTAPGNGTFGNVVKIASNPEGEGTDPPFGGIIDQNFGTISQVINSLTYKGNMSFTIYSPDCLAASNTGTGFLNVTIPNDLMNCSTADQWYVTLNSGSGPVLQTPTITTNSTYTMIYIPQFTYGSDSTEAVQILSTQAVPEFASTFSSMLLATVLVLAAFAAALFTVTMRSHKPED